ncbi:hypothetical protein BX600DRAFT_468633 [Xylariales sp. PMI_506]|nr:hypothetical protein BX600DRAFT_468633 [Xylariales sp. PMI_506]
MDMSATRNPKLRTACDRCYELKERCKRATPSAHCARCERLGLVCSTQRPVRPVGRRAHHAKKDSVTRMTSTRQRNIPHSQDAASKCLSNVFSGQQPEEKALLQFLLDQPGSLDRYVVCPSFAAEQQESLAIQLPAALPLLKDAYLACAVTVKQLQSGTTADMDTSSTVGYISKAMSALRSLRVLSPEDTALCHTLGAVLAFSIYSSIGVGVPDICRYCLGTTNPLAQTAMSHVKKDPWQSFLVLLETMDCLVYRKKPTIRIQISSVPAVDRHLGLCLPLLPHYQDLCVISNSLLNANDATTLARIQKQLDDITSIVEPWQPSGLDQLVERFDTTEIVHLLAQAKVYRLGALLMGHRLRYPFGQEDIKADIWAKEIMMELETATRVTKRPMKFVTLPFIIAAVEVQDESLRFETLQRVDDCVDHYAPLMQKATHNFLSRVWRERDLNVTIRWFDSVHKPCPVLDSFFETCL